MTTTHARPVLNEIPEGGWLEGDQLAVELDGARLEAYGLRTTPAGTPYWVSSTGSSSVPVGVADRWLREERVYAAILVDRPKLPTARGSVVRGKYKGYAGIALLVAPEDVEPWYFTHLDVSDREWVCPNEITDWTVVYDPEADS